MNNKHPLLQMIFGILAWSGMAFAGTLSDVPLTLKGGVPPNVLFALSVEYPTANTAAYQDSNGYSPSTPSLGYFDPAKCYLYDSGNQWFYPSGVAVSAVCSSSWSGSFLNWATMTGLDEFRFAMTGGNRYRDTATLTVLERAYQSGQGGTGNFTDKTFNTASLAFAGSSPYAGGTTRTISNQGQGVQMAVSYTGTTTTTTTTTVNDTAICGNPTSGASHCNGGFDLSNNDNANCSAWTGDGSSGSPYTCTAFPTFSGGGGEVITIGFCSHVQRVGSVRICDRMAVTYPTTTTTTATGAVVDSYYVRAKVCDSSIGLESDCTQYGTSYKPTGVIQQNGSTMRFGVLSYYNANDIDNAVMRSKLKYVAPLMYAAGGGTTANANLEWNSADGTFVNNPDATVAAASYGAAVGNSGVINYMNQFGKNAQQYKTYDDIGKLYYEALGYLRGRSATPTFYQGSSANSAYADGFPVITTWDDPIQYACQKNYIITLGDNHTHCDKRLPGGTYTSTGGNQCNANNASTPGYSSNRVSPSGDEGDLGGDTLNVTTWTNKLGNLETPALPNLATTMTGAGPASFYMSGLAYYAHSQDIRPDVATQANTLGSQTVKSFVINVEENKDCSYNKQFWYAAKYGGADSFDSSGNPLNWSTTMTLPPGACSSNAPPWYSSTATSSGAWPKTLLRAGNPLSMITAVQSAFSSINAEIGNESALSQSSGSLPAGGGAYIYRAIYNSLGWTGDVQAYSIDATATVSAAPVWLASTNLPAAGSRTILTYNDGLKVDGTLNTLDSNKRSGVAFAYTNMSLREQGALNVDANGTLDIQGIARVSYLQGSSSNEAPSGLNWRARTSDLGDIINSNPLYVGAPSPAIHGPGYSSFASTYLSRPAMVYVGANDGMVHGFDARAIGATGATPGKELIAFVPSGVYTNLPQLMSPAYGHKYYVDGSPSASEACFGLCTDSSNSVWKTVLVGGLNGGGQSIYALDITNPAAFSSASPSSTVLWEFTDRVDRDLGYTFSKPIIRKMNNGKWAVIFGSGYNNLTADGNASTTGRAYLYIVYIDGPGTGNAWVLGTHYFKIEVRSPTEGASPTLPLSVPNGLSTATGVDSDLNGTVDYIYAGDVQGNLWKFDVTSSDPTLWKVALGTTTPLPLFTAQDTLGNGQPITTSPEVTRSPNGGYMVLFGTGSYINITDPQSVAVQSYYGIWDQNNGTQVARSRLQQQGVTATVGVASTSTTAGATYFIQSNCLPNYSTTAMTTGTAPTCPAGFIVANSPQQQGWVFDLPSGGERVVSDALLQAGVLTFTTLRAATDPCTGNTGGNEYNVSYLTGGQISRGVFDLNRDGVLSSLDQLVVSSLGTAGNPNPSFAPSGRVLAGGASDRPLRFAITDPIASTTGIPTTCSAANFVPGWGCLSEMGPCKAVVDFTSSDNLSNSTGNNIGNSQKCLTNSRGRLSWRQLMQ